jgi:hypothetical protein
LAAFLGQVCQTKFGRYSLAKMGFSAELLGVRPKSDERQRRRGRTPFNWLA